MRRAHNGIVSSLGIRTDLVLNAGRSSVTEGREYAVVRTPSNPGFYFGNFLILGQPPGRRDLAKWETAFDRAFRDEPEVRHVAFACAGRMLASAREAFSAAGYTIDEMTVLTGNAVCAVATPAGIDLRAMRGDSDWDRQMAMQMASRPPAHGEEEYQLFKERQIAHHRSLAEHGLWLGAFEGDRLAGSCGIFPAGSEFARYQDVTVDPRYRRRGIARALVAAAGAWALEQPGVRTLVIVSESEEACRIYRRAGLRAVQDESRLWKARRE